ncbi:DNA polymerase III subunit delta [Candidatus Parcubacteria bacterium]|nr:MAG: DNA polymerase III subunit delta [Candidatus Parcubacteria bacterium]
MIIFLYGPDTFRSRRKLNELKEKFIKEVDKSALNLEKLDAKKMEISDFRRAIMSQPFLAKKRLIIVENLFAKPQKKLCHEILKTLSDMKNDNIIIFWDGETPKKPADGCLPLFKKLADQKYSQQFKLLTEAETKKWILQEIKKIGSVIENEAANLLACWIGNDLWQLDSEIKKLAAYCQNRPITVLEINLLTKSKLDENIFNLTDALGQKNKAKALRLIQNQLDLGISQTSLLSKMIWHYKNLLLVKNFSESGCFSYFKIAAELKIHPFVAQKALQQSGNYTHNELKKIYQRLLEIDFSFKTSQVDGRTLFDLFVVRV